MNNTVIMFMAANEKMKFPFCFSANDNMLFANENILKILDSNFGGGGVEASPSTAFCFPRPTSPM